MHIHIDPLGGLAGDMFLAAMLDAWPQEMPGLEAAVRAAGLPPEISLTFKPHADHALTGARFVVEMQRETHSLGAYRDIAAGLKAADLGAGVRDHALAIFAILAEAEAHVHGVAVEDVTFHELAGWDSIADIVGAAYLIDRLKPASWSVAPLPMGRGRVMTAHGPLPLPAPAAARLLEGFPLIDDGIEGERVTPTGAAILRHLKAGSGPHNPMRLRRSGIGFGTRTFPGLSNAVRILVFDEAPSQAEQVGVIAFEVDDQTPEDLAAGLDALRGREDVLDVVQFPVFGKKGRLMTSIQVLCRPERLDAVIDGCFLETTTIGLRWQRTARSVLPRRQSASDDVSVKIVQRPDGGRTAKADIDAVTGEPGFHRRRDRRQQAETAALKGPNDD